MKKTLLALLVAGVATSAQAKVELFKDDASSVSVKGEIATFLYTSDTDDKTAANNDVKTDLDVNAWAKVQFDFSHKVTDTLTAGGTFEIQSGTWIDGSKNDAEFDDVAAYLKGNFGLIGIGEIGDVSDSNDAVSKTDILNELDNNYLPAYAKDSTGHGISYTKGFGGLTLVVDAYTEAAENTDSVFGLSANYAAEIFSVGAMYQNWGDKQGSYQDKSSMAIAADVNLGKVTLAGSYNVVSVDTVKDVKNTTLAATFAATDSFSIYGVAGMQDDGSKDDGQEFILGASYAASSLLTAFTEIATRDNHGNADKTEILVGAYFDF
ncbi:porin [Vibrio sp. ZOR0018]|uniref:porin n=1 Tax=Vibrio sp. ZOR0018 TaxID=1339225 RepID=UPI000691F621|nr:porin [Vibrio sp. ZOR0018]